MDKKDSAEKAFKWIIEILGRLDIPYQISGGLAAQVYGSKRPLADIDIDISEDDFPKIKPEVAEYIIFGPSRYQQEGFDIDLMTLDYEGQEIDLAGLGTGRLYDSTKEVWVSDDVDLSKAERREIFGVKVPVINKEMLIDYKRQLGRDVDLEDIKQIADGNVC